jgi:hypothetical protein
MASPVSAQKEMTMVTLKDGSQVPEPALITTMMGLQAAKKEGFALFDLVEKCKDSNYKFVANPFGDSKAILKKLALIDGDERVHDIVKSIVLNATEGNGLSLKLVDPRKKA